MMWDIWPTGSCDSRTLQWGWGWSRETGETQQRGQTFRCSQMSDRLMIPPATDAQKHYQEQSGISAGSDTVYINTGYHPLRTKTKWEMNLVSVWITGMKCHSRLVLKRDLICYVALRMLPCQHQPYVIINHWLQTHTLSLLGAEC